MTTITFADHELDELKNFYQLELDKTAKRLEDLKGIIQKLSGQPQTQESPLIEPKKESIIPVTRKAKSNKTKSSTISWRTFIPRLLKKENRYLNIPDIAKSAIEKFHLTDRDKTLHTLTTTLARMAKMGVLKSEKKERQRMKYYGLTSWKAETHVVPAVKETTTNEAEIALPAKPSQGHAKSITKTKTPVIPWRKFIPQIIEEKGSLTIQEFANEAMKKFNYSNRDQLLRTLSPTLVRMTKLGKLTFDKKPGQRSHSYGLPSIPADINKTNGSSDWPNFIFETLNKSKRVLSLKEFLRSATVTRNISKYETASAKRSLSSTLRNLAGKAKTLKTIQKEGQNGRSYGLANWFDDEGKLIVIYK